MSLRKTGKCSGDCGYDNVIIVNRKHNLCQVCNKKRLDKKRDKPRVRQQSIKPKSKKGREISKQDRLFFKEIWDERPHRSEVGGESLNFVFSPPMFFVFSHVLSKKAYPELRHKKENIILMTLEEHQLWEFHKHKLKDKPQWEWVFEREQQLKSIK